MNSFTAALDRALVINGQDVTLRRQTGRPPNVQASDVTVRANVTGRQVAEEGNGMTQAMVAVIMSPTQILAAQWPGGHDPDAVPDPAVPRLGDRLEIGGQWHEIVDVSVFSPGGEVVRIEISAMAPAMSQRAAPVT